MIMQNKEVTEKTYLACPFPSAASAEHGVGNLPRRNISTRGIVVKCHLLQYVRFKSIRKHGTKPNRSQFMCLAVIKIKAIAIAWLVQIHNVVLVQFGGPLQLRYHEVVFKKKIAIVARVYDILLDGNGLNVLELFIIALLDSYPVQPKGNVGFSSSLTICRSNSVKQRFE